MKIEFTNLYALIPEKKKIFRNISNLIKNSNFIGGDEIIKFQNEFSKFTNTKYCIAVANGTDALEISLEALKLPKNSEVIVPCNTWISTAEAVIRNDLKLVFCDINLNDYTICLNDLKKKINTKTSAIIAVHLYGNPSDIIGIKNIIRGKKIKILEDCAQAHGSYINKKHVGCFGEISTFSFFPGKNLGCFGDGGAIVTNNKNLAEQCLRLRNHGAIYKYDHKFIGRNSRLDTIQASILRVKLKNYFKVLEKRKELAFGYFRGLRNLKGLNLFVLKKKFKYSFHQFVIRTDFRDKLKEYLNKSGISTMIHYPYMLNELSFFKKKYFLKNSKNLGKKILSLPISEEHSQKQVSYICDKIIFFFKKYT